jgi:hypothetical protein
MIKFENILWRCKKVGVEGLSCRVRSPSAPVKNAAEFRRVRGTRRNSNVKFHFSPFPLERSFYGKN